MTHCQHFGLCGGCAVAERSAIDKPALLRAALLRAGYAAPLVAPLVEVGLQTRRRADLAALRGGGVTLGLHQARSAEVVDMRECALLDPRIVLLLDPLRALLRSLEGFRRTASVVINLLDNGADVLLRIDADLTQLDRSKIIAFARAQHLPRVSVAQGQARDQTRDQAEPEPVIILDPPVVTFSGIAVEPAPGAFLQASPGGEAAIIAATLAGLPRLTPKSRIVELYAGMGTLSFALAGRARVEAYEGNAQAVAAQSRAIRRANVAGRITLAQRDLARRPLQPADLAGRAAVVLDPPYAGAAAQMKFLLAAAVPRIIYISCNPDALAADAYGLAKAGYALLTATPIDQFPFSANLESVVVFAKER